MTHKQLERVIKGFANHRRLAILELLQHRPGLSVDEVAEQLSIGYMNASDHLRKMAIAGLVSKRNEGTFIHHALTPRAVAVLVFCKKLK